MISAIHGFTGTPAMWDVLADHDLPTHGLPILGHGYIADGSETFADEIERLAKALPNQCKHLVGYSLGARLALAVALHVPKRIARLSLIGVHPGIEDERQRAQRRQDDQRLSSLLRQDGIASFVETWEALPMWDSQRRLSPEARKRQHTARTSHDAYQLGYSLNALGTGSMPPMWNRLSALSIPVDLIVGALDEKYLAVARRMVQLLPHARLEVIEDAGHNVLLEAPEAVAQILSTTRTT